MVLTKHRYKFLDPKIDIVFKKIFGQHPHILKSFLNAVLPLPEDGLIESLEYLTPEQAPRIPGMKNTVADVKCKDVNGRQFIVEMQLNWTDSFTKRLTFGASKAYVQQLSKGESYNMLCPVYGLGIVNAVFDHDSPEWFHHYKTINVADSKKTLDEIELIFIELPKFTPQNWTEKKIGVLWMRFLREIGEQTSEVDKALLDVQEISDALDLAQESAFSREELEFYDKYWDTISVEKTIIADAINKGLREGRQQGVQQGIQQGMQQGMQQGIQQGMQQGIQQGIREGLEKGREEGAHQNALEIAGNMLKIGIGLEIISNVTGLPQEEIRNLIK